MRKFSIVFLFSLTLLSSTIILSAPNVHATEYVLEEGAESEGCSSIGGVWSEENLLCYVSDVKINKDDSLIIDIGYMVLFTGTLENNGKFLLKNPHGGVMFGGVFNNNEGASFEGHGIISNDVIVPSHPDFEVELGMINNYGTIDNFGGFTVGGKYQRISSSTPDDFVVLENHGTFTNHAFLGFNPGTIVNNHGTFVNKEQVSFSTLNNEDAANLTNESTGSFSVGNVLNNKGNITNQGTFEDRFCSGVVNDSGTISGNELLGAECSEIKTNDNTSNIEKPDANGGGGCLIATAAYGTEMAPQVQLLREIRDNTVLSTESGAAFMTGFNQLYYSFSPVIADYERENPLFQEAVRVVLTPMINSLSIMTLADKGNESQVLGLGISVIALNLGMYLGVPAAIGFTSHRFIQSRK